MILFPKVGDECFYVTRITDGYMVRPVTIAEPGIIYARKERTPEGVTFNLGYDMSLTVQYIDNEHFILETYEATRRDLFRTNRGALRAIARMDRKRARS